MVLIDSAVITAIDHTLGPSLFLDFLISFSFAWNRIILSRILPHMSAGLETPTWPVPPAAPDTEALQTIDIIASVLPLLERPRMPCSVLRLLSHGDIWP